MTIEIVSGHYLCLLMRRHGKTIAGLARQMSITQKRVREVRAHGVRGHAYAVDWIEAITA